MSVNKWLKMIQEGIFGSDIRSAIYNAINTLYKKSNDTSDSLDAYGNAVKVAQKDIETSKKSINELNVKLSELGERIKKVGDKLSGGGDEPEQGVLRTTCVKSTLVVSHMMKTVVTTKDEGYGELTNIGSGN